MKKTEILLLEERKQPISCEEFLNAGWTLDEVLCYFRMVDELRALSITVEKCCSKRDDSLFIEIEQCAGEIINQSLTRLTDFLRPFFDTDITVDLNRILLKYYTHVNAMEEHKYLNDRCDDSTYMLAQKLYLSSDYLRWYIERQLHLQVTGCPVIIGETSETVGNDYLRKQYFVYKETADNNQIPILPQNISSYAQWEKWADDYSKYEFINDEYSEAAEEIEEELRKRGISVTEESQSEGQFAVSRDALYVYAKMPNCIRKHEVVSATVKLFGIQGKPLWINANYCNTCKRFFLTMDDYEVYLERFKVLPARIIKVSSESQSVDSFDRRQVSDLRLCGYTVAENANMTSSQRQMLLASLIDRHIFSKAEILNHIRMLINTNGSQKNMHRAREKWREDELFVMDYQIESQKEQAINKFKSASKHIEIHENQ